jgi:hypothetical protein
MLRKTALSLTLMFGLASAAHAAAAFSPMPANDGNIIKVGEGCGGDRWRSGPDGACHWFHGPYGSNRGTRFECPPGWHIGNGGGACWPNR